MSFLKRLFSFIKRILKPVKKETIKQVAFSSKDFAWFNTAKSQLNVKEIYGKNHNPKILEYHKKTSLKAKTDEVSWCSSFVNWCFDSNGIKGTNSAAARSWLNWGRTIKKPQRGCVVIFWRGSITGWKGHTGFYVKEDESYIYVLGGNQKNAVNISAYPKTRLLGYRLPS